jgi:hypothetical protein
MAGEPAWASSLAIRLWPPMWLTGFRLPGPQSRLPGGCRSSLRARGASRTRPSTRSPTARTARLSGCFALCQWHDASAEPDTPASRAASPSRLRTPSSCVPLRLARTSFGHWEGDLIAFRQDFGKGNLTSLVERQSRYTILSRNPDRNAIGVVAGVIGKLKALPASARQSVTFDRGTEFARYGLLKSQLGMESYFCKPQAPWQKGSVENANGRVRRFLSRDTDIAAVSDEALMAICHRLNATPRKCLGFRTPQEVLMSHLGPITVTGSRSFLDPDSPRLRNPDRLRPGEP